MKILNHRFALIAGALLVFPALYFMVAAFLNYEMGVSTLWQPIDPVFEKPANKHLGWNINLLILFGPVLAFVLNFFSIVKIKWQNEKDQVHLGFSIRKHWVNILIAAVAALVLASIFAYLVAENCK
jgi:hypothetical protein